MEIKNFSGSDSFFLCDDNVSRDSVSDGFKIPDTLRTSGLVLAVGLLLYQLLGLPWNLLVIVIVVKKKLYQQPTIILILSLVVTSWLQLLLPLSLSTVTGLAGEYLFGESDFVRCVVCKTHVMLEKLFLFTLLFTIPLLALDRFLFIHKPLHYNKLVTVGRTVVVVVLVWLLAALVSAVHQLLLNHVRFDPISLICIWDVEQNRPFHIFSVLAILLPYLLFLLCDVWVVFIALRNIRAVYNVQKPSLKAHQRRTSMAAIHDKNKHMRSKKQVHLTRVFGGIICSSSISWLPLALLGVLFLAAVSVPLAYVTVSVLLFHLQLVLNPILESTLISDIRKPMQRLFCPSRRCGTMCCGGGNSGGCCTTCDSSAGEGSGSCVRCSNVFVLCNAIWLAQVHSGNSNHTPTHNGLTHNSHAHRDHAQDDLTQEDEHDTAAKLSSDSTSCKESAGLTGYGDVPYMVSVV